VAAITLLLGRGADTSKADDDGRTPVYTASESGEAEAVHVLLKAGADANVADNKGDTAIHAAANFCQLDVVRVLAERWPTNPLAWRMFLMGGGAASELQDYLAPPANRTTRNHLPRLYSKPDMMKEVYKYLYKPRYADLDRTNADGMTALQVTEMNGEEEEMATLLRGLSLG
jgi:ankyrin repeat protein